MYCPICGHELTLVEREKEDIFGDQSDWYKCNKCRCFGDDYPLVCHHPLGGMDSKPGDSWSLTWLK